MAKLTVEADRLHRHSTTSSGAASRLPSCVRVVLPGELRKHAVSVGTNVITRFTSPKLSSDSSVLFLCTKEGITGKQHGIFFIGVT